MKLVPLADRVLLKPVEAMETTASGIILSTATKEKPVVSEVVAVGPGGVVDGNEVKMTPDLKTNVAHLYCLGDSSGWTRGLMMASAMGVLMGRKLAGYEEPLR